MITINELIKIRLKVTFWHSSCPDLRPLKDDSVIWFKSFLSLYLCAWKMILRLSSCLTIEPDRKESERVPQSFREDCVTFSRELRRAPRRPGTWDRSKAILCLDDIWSI